MNYHAFIQFVCSRICQSTVYFQKLAAFSKIVVLFQLSFWKSIWPTDSVALRSKLDHPIWSEHNTSTYFWPWFESQHNRVNSYSVGELCHNIHQANNKDHCVVAVSSNLSEFKLEELRREWVSKDPSNIRETTFNYLLNWQNKQRFQNQDHNDDNSGHQGLVLKDSLICTRDFYCTTRHLLCICNLDPSRIF